MEDDEQKFICFNCVGEPYLKAEIKRFGQRAQCTYCLKKSKSFRIEELSEKIDHAFRTHYVQEFEDEDFDSSPDGNPVVKAIEIAADVPIEAAIDIQAILEYENYDKDIAEIGYPSPYDADSYYARKEITDDFWQIEWSDFEKILQEEARYFSQEGTKLLTSVFKDIGALQTADDTPLIKMIFPDHELSSLYRAKVFQSAEKLKTALAFPDINIGSPPALFAVAGRMNARGISVFYGSNDAEVALAEVRPPVGSRVVIAKFNVTRPLQVLDLTALDKISVKGSVFDVDYARRLGRAMFLGTLSRRMTRPVMPDDEAIDYLITQAIADFLATNKENHIDGIIFPSSQVSDDSINVVLFHKASGIELINLPTGTTVEAATGELYGDLWEKKYTVYESLPPPVEQADKKSTSEFDLFKNSDSPFRERRMPALKIDIESIVVHEVQAVKFFTEAYPVERKRNIKTNFSKINDE